MQEYTDQALSLATTSIKSLKNWWWPPQEQLPTSPIELLKYYLTNSNVEYKTRHSDKKILYERLGMMFGELVGSGDGKWRSFRATVDRPLEEIQPPQPQPLTPQQQQQQGQVKPKSIVLITGQLKLKTSTLKCTLTLTLVLHPQIETHLPTILIRNPDPSKTQPNPQYTHLNPIYTSILGGVTLSPAKVTEWEKLYWGEYRAGNLVALMGALEKLLYECFPFVKKYVTYEDMAEGSQCWAKIGEIKEKLGGCLANVQQLVVIRESIDSQRRHLQSQTKRLKQILSNPKDPQQPLTLSQQISSSLNLFKITKNSQLLELVSMQRACADCLRYLENEVEKPIKIKQKQQDKTQYQGMVELVWEWSARLFELRFQIREIVIKCQEHCG